MGPGLSSGNAVFATGTSGIGITFSGSSNINITGGNVCTNASVVNNSQVSLNSGKVLCASGTITGSGSLSPGTTQAGVPNQTISTPPTPDCSGLTVQTFNNATNPLNLQPGIYNTAINITRPPSGPPSGDDERVVNFAPGMHCLNAGLNGQSGKYTGTDVMFVVNGGNFSLAGTVQVNLTKPATLVDGSGNQWAGMLVYMPSANPGTINVGGNQNGVDTFTGTVYAPTATCSIGQTNSHSLTVTGNVICSTFSRIGGNSNVGIAYNDNAVYHLLLPATIELSQ